MSTPRLRKRVALMTEAEKTRTVRELSTLGASSRKF